MADNDPFAEPDDTERTVIKPNPGGRLNVPQSPAPATAPQQPAPDPAGQPAYGVPSGAVAPSRGRSDGASLDLAMTGMNGLIACATPLFALASRIRNRAQHMDPDKLRQSVVGEIRAFENRALKAGIDPQKIKVARYAICATLDDVVLNTPWGGQSIWSQQSMVGTFHRETVGGDRFYDLLARLEKDPSNNLELLEFLYMCLSLGFEGRLRVEQGGGEKHLQIRNGLARLIRAQHGPVEHEVSPHWKGVNKPHRPLSAWRPVWIGLAAAAVLSGGIFTGLSFALGGSTDQLIGRLSVLDSGATPELLRRAPPPPPPPEPAQDVQLETIKGFLQDEIAEGLVTVFRDANTITVRINGQGMFASASDVLQDRFTVPLERVAAALNGEPGPVIVAGHSDNVPIRTAKFPNNTRLSLARAESVMKMIAPRLDDPSRLTAEGRADKQPIASNDTAEGRAENRRIEVLLVKEDQ
ncbi:type VI secretion system protein TssL, long form [Qingshengfaniella alkalisoli]|uniref:Type VI secretion system protein TssL n=1 Tax=Qingshengfaniella alkalisoli TaxID=2599296 RepID=A0A5B8J998_9RHOB|nr:type VI secretion system protein TssL, long form [Qingshengfaniella alkalisoli]QDY70917.1 type VI secretion system protein TssL [Qingshengfaniella alkalisoli]